ncbi:ferrous iron transport protein B [Helicobacter zhangjianzhongii]|uniref:Ferrous iron transport protein B n=1 Tax=Helicobacter zhangjianzhongii TaxID=2974574 RepID=A0ACC6FTR0_9HELI|nr:MULTISPECIES: ferrous iron transport protein B [unclassified Helicobacter]MDL0080788.1 ferrous iron transport protein B [Helicobacter sp. CPD2-1]MDL0082686.1 ferrous iron transport protein B [Helicobacter sp. XJK30-2]
MSHATSPKRTLTIALVGQPNVGKSSLINALSGSHLKVGNFSGVTIEKTQASFTYQNTHITIIDLPGSYSLNHYSPEEKITKDFLESRQYDIVLNVLDSTNLARNLALTGQIMDLGIKIVLGLNMIDEARDEQVIVNHKLLSEILGVPCVPISASTGENLSLLLDTLLSYAQKPLCAPKRVYNDKIEKAIAQVEQFITQKSFYELHAYPKASTPLSARGLAILLIKQDGALYAYLHDKPCYHEIVQYVNAARNELSLASDEQNIARLFHHDAIAYAQGAAQETITYPKSTLEQTKNVDSILLHKRFGIPIFLVLMFVLFEATFYVGGFFKDYIELGFENLAEVIREHIVVEAFASLLCDGVIGGVGTILAFLPLIAVLYFGIALLESSGYMARIAFLLDGFFHKFGLHGKSFIPLVAGFGCSVPAYMATRTLKNRNERLITLFVIGFMSCSARLPIYVLFIGAFFDQKHAGLVLFGIYLFGAIIALLLAKLLKLSIFTGHEEPFVMEMPKYRMPNWRVVWFSVWSKVVMFLKKAAGFIFLGSILIWFASQYPKSPELEEQYTASQEALMQSKQFKALSKQDQQEALWYLHNEYNENFLRQTYSGKIGEALRPIFAPLDFDWRLSISLVAGFAAKEVVVSTLGILYALGDDVNEESTSLQQNLRDNISFPTAIAFIVFVMFYIPCFAATITFGREAGGIKFVAYLFIFTSIVAYCFALLGYYCAWLGYKFFMG